MKKFRVTLNEHQLRLISQCVEDCHRFMGGQMELWNTISCLHHKNFMKLRDKLEELKPLVTPDLPRGGCYGWDGGSCPNISFHSFISSMIIGSPLSSHRNVNPLYTFQVSFGSVSRCSISR